MDHRKLNRLSDSAVKEKQRFSFRKVSGVLTGALLGSTFYFANSTQVHADTTADNTSAVKGEDPTDSTIDTDSMTVSTATDNTADSDTSSNVEENDSEGTLVYAETGGYRIPLIIPTLA